MTDLSFLDDGLQTNELDQAADALAELEREIARTDIPADSEAMTKAKENLAFLQQQVRDAGEDITKLRKLAAEHQAAAERLKRDRPTAEEMESAEQAVDDARTALANGTGTRADLEAAVKKVAELKLRAREADRAYGVTSEDIQGRMNTVADEAGSRPTELPNKLASTGGGDSAAAGKSSDGAAASDSQATDLAKMLAASQQQPQQAAAPQMPTVAMPSMTSAPTQPQQSIAAPAAANALSAEDVQRLLKGNSGLTSGTRESTTPRTPAATQPTRLRPNFSAQPGAGETKTSKFDGAAPATVQSVHTSSDVSGRSQASPGAFATNGNGATNAQQSTSGTGRAGGAPMMPPMMPPMGGAGGGAGGGRKKAGIVDTSGDVHGESVREAAVENGSIVSRTRKAGER